MSKLGSPFLHQISSPEENFDRSRYPFNIPAFDDEINIALDSRVAMLVGENGSGKSTLLEAIAECCGFDPEGGNQDHYRESFEDRSELAQALRLSWMSRTTEGFFLRAESFFNFAMYIEGMSALRAYGGKSLHKLEASGHAQFLIAAHSPILLSYPRAKVISFDDGAITPIDYKESNHYQLTKSLLDALNNIFAGCLKMMTLDDD